MSPRAGVDRLPLERTDDLRELVTSRSSGDPPLLATGTGSALSRGLPPPEPVSLLDTSRLNRIIEHSPEDLTIEVEAGVPLARLQARLKEHNQWLPVTMGPVAGTAGGWIASGRRGPLAGGWGSSRDFLIGVRFIDGRGRDIRAGGRVVKNVAGYDFMKLLIGSLGEFGVVAEATFKVLPRPSRFGGVLVNDPSPERVAAAVAEVPGKWLPSALLRMGDGVSSERIVAVFAGSAIRVESQVEGLKEEWGASASTLEEDAACGLLSEVEGWRADGTRVLGWGGGLPSLWADASVPELLFGGEWATDLLGGHIWWRLPGGERKRVERARRELGGGAAHVNLDVEPHGDERAWSASPKAEVDLWTEIKKRLDPESRLVSGRLPGGV